MASDSRPLVRRRAFRPERPAGSGAHGGGYAPQGERRLSAPASYVPTAPTAQAAAPQEGAPQGARSRPRPRGRRLVRSFAGRVNDVRRESPRPQVGSGKPSRRTALCRLIVALVAGGHALLEGVPASPRRCSCARWPAPSTSTWRASSSRPTSCPADITGSMVWDAGQSSSCEGPVFTNLLLASEISTPRELSPAAGVMEGTHRLDRR